MFVVRNCIILPPSRVFAGCCWKGLFAERIILLFRKKKLLAFHGKSYRKFETPIPPCMSKQKIGKENTICNTHSQSPRDGGRKLSLFEKRNADSTTHTFPSPKIPGMITITGFREEFGFSDYLLTIKRALQKQT